MWRTLHGTAWALGSFSALGNVCLVWEKEQSRLLWEKACEEWDQSRSPSQYSALSTLDQAAWTTRGVPSSEHPQVPGDGVPNLHITHFSWRHSRRSIRQHALQRRFEEPASAPLVPTHVCLGARGATKLLVSIPTLPQSAPCPCRGAPARSKPTLAPCLASRDENKLQ